MIKYQFIKADQRSKLESKLKDTLYAGSYRVAVLYSLMGIMLQNKYHISDIQGGMFSFGHDSVDKNKQDSINAALRLSLEKINKTGLLTTRVYTSAAKKIDNSNYIADVELVAHLAEMTSRLQWLTADHLLPVAEELHKNGIVNDSSFLRLKNDINDEKIETALQLNEYCTPDRIFDMAKYADDPDIWLKQMHEDIASILPGLSFTDFNYTPIPDTSFSLPGTRFRISLNCNGRTYSHTSLAMENFRDKLGKITPKDLVVEDFHRIFNKILTDQHSRYRLHSVMMSPTNSTNDRSRHFALIALRDDQVELFMKEPCISYMFVSMETYDSTLTSGRIDSALAGWKKIGLFAHLSEAEIKKATADAQAADLLSVDQLLSNFPRVIYSFQAAFSNQDQSYAGLLKQIAQISHGAFKPVRITQKNVKNGVEVAYYSNGKMHFYTFKTQYRWADDKFLDFIKNLGRENVLPGDFYALPDADAIIYLTKQQYADSTKLKLLNFQPIVLKEN
ncbi:MAG: hypothetical protein JSU01_01635 [Bacteroidetes bacterium]|nr:hypothetical protein [Bacteroidota bacterium]